jgi:WD40 repeat protein
MSRLPLNRSSNIILGMMALAIIAVVTCPVTLAFSTPLHLRHGAVTRPLQLKHSNNVEYSQRRHPTFVSLYRDHENEESDEDENDENGEEEDVVFYDDFGGTVLGGVDPPPPIVYQDMDVPIGSVVDDSSSSFAELQEGLQVLSERIAQTRDSQVQRDTRLAKNWRMGNWKVRGFQLDKSNMDSTTTTKTNSNHPRTTQDADSTASLVTGGPRLDNANRNSDNNPQQTNHDPLSKLLQEVSSNNKDTDKDASHNTSSNDGPIHVSKIVTDISSSSSGGLESNVLAVGRTDGSICIVELGTQYLTKFTAVPKLIVEPGNNETEDGGISVRIQSELMNQDELKEAMRDDHGSDEKYTMPRPKQDGDNEINFSDGMDESFGEGDDGDNTPNDDVAMAEQDTMGTPFKILHQFQAHEKGDSITALVLDEGHVYSAGGNKGDIKVWAIPEDEDQENESNNGSGVRSAPKMIPIKSLSNAHADTVVALKTLSMDGSEDHQLLLSAAADGSFALWDRTSGDLVFRCQITDDYGEPVGVTCADVETAGENHVIYLGLSTGHVVGYIVNDVITSASIGDECLVPSCRFVAQEADSGGLTALTCAGDGTIGISSRSRSGQTPQSSTVLLTGGADGTIKQW